MRAKLMWPHREMGDNEVKTEDEVKAEAVKSEVPEDDELKRVTLEILGKTKLEELTKKTVRRSVEKELGRDPPRARPACHPPSTVSGPTPAAACRTPAPPAGLRACAGARHLDRSCSIARLRLRYFAGAQLPCQRAPARCDGREGDLAWRAGNSRSRAMPLGRVAIKRRYRAVAQAVRYEHSKRPPSANCLVTRTFARDYRVAGGPTVAGPAVTGRQSVHGAAHGAVPGPHENAQFKIRMADRVPGGGSMRV
jgi:hypothetical protein